MNEALRSPDLPLTTQAAEGLMRRRWSVAEIEAMVRAGVIAEDERFELIGGEVVPMSPKGPLHELLKVNLTRFWNRELPDDIRVAQETTFRLNQDTFVEPDLVFYRRDDGLLALTPATVLLAIEVADSSLAYDLHRKTRLYATVGVREVWVIEAKTLLTHVSRRPGLDGFAEQLTIQPDAPLHVAFAPALDLRLAQLPLV